ncbi:glycosyltransferase family 4 protein [Pseudoalteromonas tunicata]|uniref:Lipopolysaccharide core biosynthesis protein RfaG (Glucosyltransferase I) n=1 Tax=Pseudoalteromonas tunicata D2 TaxID=87626 RepID=A4C8I5_9GAMM|nr:glycosyltransferase family 4 protein [Pseudoalteromonas tunicata]ATC93404.1 hypothetical protein PTUN_a0639 [Pseudoalteromonas tunicata]AXT32446.1 glycosyltransferase [Pseudoalteromonas tunicata]EAR28900.1 Lipopolysaccharide core biosynthesis protein RfaG (Glucosyltransferase I) [Pseudoalteromonas tunicata D2]
MGVLITSNAFYPNIGGVENSLLYLAKSYLKQGVSVDIVVSDVNLVNEKVLSTYEEYEGISIHRYQCYQTVPKYLKPFYFLKRYIKAAYLLHKLKKLKKPEITISRFHTNVILAKLVGLKNIVYLVPGEVSMQNCAANSTSNISDSWHYRLRIMLDLRLQQFAMKISDRLFVFSRTMQKQVLDSVNKTAVILKPGVDVDRFTPITEKQKQKLKLTLNLPQDKKILLIVGRFVLAKGFIFALESLKYLDNCHLVIVGAGDEEESYKDYVHENNLGALVTFTGVKFNTECYYSVSDFFLMTSVYEPFGQTILEAMASGLPVIAFSQSAGVITATHEILTESDALFINELSGYSLAKGVISLINNESEVSSLSSRSRRLACELYSWERLALSLLQQT